GQVNTYADNSQVVMEADANRLLGTPDVTENVEFNGKTLAVLNNTTDLSGDVTLTVKPANSADLSIAYDNGMTFNGTMNMSSSSINGYMSMSSSGINGYMNAYDYYFKTNDVGYYGENGKASEIVGAYSLNQQLNIKCGGDYACPTVNTIRGTFGVKSDTGVDMSIPCDKCLVAM
ncbi:MAG: hypothetical protein IJ638_01845, partial [Alphaproteobacteria bacterium]|nr:hypothetical protein [Alphaproteobacteria bacterium]